MPHRRPTRRGFCKQIVGGAATLAGAGLSGCHFPLPLSPAPRLASDWNRRKDRYDIVIVGSGYGGAILAARLAKARPDAAICVLERGKEWPVGSFPDTNDAAHAAIRLPGLNPTGLYEFRPSAGIAVLQGCGLGGTSLINGAVAMVPEADIFDQDAWPVSMNFEALRPYFDRAQHVLGVRPHPQAGAFRKYQLLDRRARELGLQADPLGLTVNFSGSGANAHGVAQPACTNCGDCFTGCNVGSKSTVAMNYLPMARAAGAELFECTEVDFIERGPEEGWRVRGRHCATFGPAGEFTIEAGQVVLAAGSLGSTEILLRSHQRGLSLSDRLGSQFSGNGDFIGFAYNSDHQTNILGFGNRAYHPWRRNAPGPAVLGAIRYDSDRPIKDRYVVEELALPGALLGKMMETLGILPGEDTDSGDELTELARRMIGRPDDPYHDPAALNHTMAYLVLGHDTADGRVVLDSSGSAVVDWDPTAGREVHIERMNEELREHAKGLGARFVSNPVWELTDRRTMLTAHPLGGCPIGVSYEDGVVDEFGRAFAADGSLQDGLIVADGSVIPSALGANPFMTIAAVCERIAENAAAK